MTQDALTALWVNAAVFTVLMGVMLVVRALFKKRISAVMQYALWAVVIVKLLLPFGFESSLSPFGLFKTQEAPQTVSEHNTASAAEIGAISESGVQQPEAEAVYPTAPQTERVAADVKAKQETSANTAEAEVGKPQQLLPWTSWLLIAWAAGALAVGIVQALGARNLRRRAIHARLPLPQRMAHIAGECMRELGMKRGVAVVLQSALKTPAAIGVLKPVLVLPEDAAERTDEQLRHICLHELTHVRYGDLIVVALMGILRAVYWFNPFTWLGISLMRHDMEAACDARVLLHIGSGARHQYIGTVLHFAGREKDTRLIAAMGMADSRMPMERRIRSMFRKTRTGSAAKAAALGMALLMLSASVLTACQPTPEVPVVAGKNEGALESALAAAPSENAAPYEAPDRLTMDIDVPVDNYSIIFDADVVVPDQTVYPVYTVEMAKITQQQADTLRLALLDGQTLYKQGEYRSRDEIQRSIDSYEWQLQESIDDGYQGLVDSYTEILKELYAEYARTPENLTLEEADTTLEFHEEYAEPFMYGYTEVPVGEDGYRVEWTEEGRQKAIADGCSSVYGICWMESGRKMEFSVRNEASSSSVYFGYAEGNGVYNQCNTCTLDDAIEQGNALLAEAGMDFSLVSAETDTSTIDDNGNEVPEYNRFHTLTYKRNLPGVILDNIQSVVTQNLAQHNMGEPGYNGLVPYPETITMSIDDFGFIRFQWSQPLEITATESANVPLIPFDEISSRIASQIKIQTMWDEEADEYEAEWIESRRLEVTKIVLSYLVVAKADDFSSFYYIPVWNVCGDLYYRYKPDYLEHRKGGGFILDENNERKATMQYVGDTSDHSLLTISAIDGTVIPRGMHT